MEDKILVNLAEDHLFESVTDIIGRAGEGSTTRLELTIPSKLTGCSAYLDFEKPNGETLRTPKLQIENGKAVYDVVQYLLTDNGELKVQAVLITADGKIWKSSKKKYHILKSINAYTETPQKEDLLTQAIRAIDRLEAMLITLNGFVVGVVDENNVITLAGDLPEGTYTAKYKMADGSTVVIGDFEHDGSTSGGNSGGSSSGGNNGGSTGGDTGGGSSGDTTAPINQIPLSVDLDGSPFNNGKGYMEDVRLSTSDERGYKDNTGTSVTGLIRCTSTQTIRIKNIEFDSGEDEKNNRLIYVFDEDRTRLNQAKVGTVFVTNEGNGVYSGKLNVISTSKPIEYFRLCSTKLDDTSIITIEQEIV